ncbi:MAG: glycosyltransferase family 39 protein [Deltaproteobacteria bacterium]|nr:glycosyltransferase family 39 protein [Deltaproteobacteria bacterium]
MRGKRRGPWPVLLPAAVAVLAARLAGARVWPPFSDEVLYVSWAHIIRDDPSQFFLSLTVSGIKPFYFWLVAAAHVFVPDPLFAGRAVSAVAAVATLIGTASLAHTVGSEEKMKDRAAGIAAVLIAVNPLLQLLTCMALIESVSIAITVWSLVLALRLAREPSVSRALVLGALIALGLLTKEYSVLSLAFLPFAWWIAGAEHAGGAGRMLALGGFAAVFLFAMVMAYPVLHDGVPIVFGTQHLAAVEGSQSVSRLASVGRNLLALERVASFQLTLPVCVLAGWALFRAVRDGRRGLRNHRGARSCDAAGRLGDFANTVHAVLRHRRSAARRGRERPGRRVVGGVAGEIVSRPTPRRGVRRVSRRRAVRASSRQSGRSPHGTHRPRAIRGKLVVGIRPR